ncbi:MAG: patatin-like phospholipase family protein [Bacteroidales bacterium]|nr:patatin-like phospholipase family protein [Bacteroidales bacterium]
MRHLSGFLLLMALAYLSVPNPALAQRSHAALDAASEARDLRVKVIKHRLDSIRIVEHRPTVALVLAGGGAKGAAHVGVISYLESIGMPVDVILGTSMGGLVGGIYSLGYDAPHLDSLIRSINWDMALSDKVPRDYLSYSSIKYKEKYVLSFPFYYDRKEFLKQKSDELQYPHRSDEIHFGAGGDDASGLVRSNLMGSLPSGMVYGQNVNNLFSSLSVGYQDEIDFYKDLPIPFICVATDLVTGTAKIWSQGKLNTALRSTMSIPGLFTPVKTQGMVLVDGGMRNNYPTDLAKKCGADIVIGVNLSSGYKSYSEINNLGDILDTGIDMMGRSSFENNIDIPDVTIKPDLHEYSMMSFDSESIDVIIGRGYEAAVAVADQLDSLKRIIGPETKSINNPVADDIRLGKVMISGVEITGVSDKESAYLQNKIAVKAGTKVGSAEIEDAVATIFATNSFDYVNYELLGEDQPYRLKFNCKKGPINKVGVGARFDTEEVVAVIVNVGLGVQKLRGASWDFTGKVGANPYVGAVYSYVAQRGMTVNAAASLRYTDRNTFTLGNNNFRINNTNLRQEVYLSNIKWSKFYLREGFRNDYYNISSILSERAIWDYNSEQLKNSYLSFFLDGRNDSLDDGYVPTKGQSVGISYRWVFGGFPHRFNKFHAVQFDALKVYGGDSFAFIPSINARVLFGKEVPIQFANTMGGSMAGRYLEQQMPFIGINNAASMSKMLGIARADFRVKLYRNNYLTGIYNYAVSVDEISDFNNWGSKVYDYHGFGLQYTYDSIVGPISANIHWSDYTNRAGAYVSIGFDF